MRKGDTPAPRGVMTQFTCRFKLNQILFCDQLPIKPFIQNALQSPAWSPPGVKASAKRKSYCTKVHPIFIRHRVVACVHVAILPSVVQCQHTEGRSANFADLRLKSVTVQTSLGPSGKGRTDHVHPYVYIHRVPKKEDTKLVAVTLSLLNRFSKFFHWHTQR